MPPEPEKGANREYTHFSTPANFPPQIVQAIVQGAFRRLAPMLPTGLLSKALDADYRAKLKALTADYDAKAKALDADYWAELADPDNRAAAWGAI